MTMPGLRELKKKRTREAIRSAALELFERRGYADTTVAEIAAAAEVAPATLFRYFPNKESLVVSDEYDDLMIMEEADQDPDERPLDRLRRMFKGTLGRMAVEQDFERLRWRQELLTGDPQLRAAIRELRDRGIHQVAADLASQEGTEETDLTARLTARLCLEAAAETFSCWVERGGRDSLDEMLDTAFDLLRDGLEPAVTTGSE